MCANFQAYIPPSNTYMLQRLKAIQKFNYLSWSLINVKNVNKFFPESEETQKGHMIGQRQGVISTKPVM